MSFGAEFADFASTTGGRFDSGSGLPSPVAYKIGFLSALARRFGAPPNS